MSTSKALDPDDRILYGRSLQPPAGYEFDAAVATTYSLDFETALVVPVSLALHEADNRDELLLRPLALLEAVERIAGRLIIFTDTWRIIAQNRPQARLCSLLENMIVEVTAPNGGAFHPKMWVLRFKPKTEGEPILVRLLVLSRNLTRDRSWDIVLQLDGEVTQRARSSNKPLVELLHRLPILAGDAAPEEAKRLTNEFAQDLRGATWQTPEPFDSVSFAVNGLGAKHWRPEECKKLGVISPFCDDAALIKLAGWSEAERPILISRPDQLACISKSTLERFQQVSVLDEMANAEDGEEHSPDSLHGLHAKAFVSENGWYTSLTVGSGNATTAAMSGKNVELFATLSGKRSKVGGVVDILGSEGFGRLIRPLNPGELHPPEPEALLAEERLDQARQELLRGGLRLHCERHDAPDGELWRLSITPQRALSLAGVGELAVWPITRGDGHMRDALSALRKGEPVDLGAMSIIDLTRFVAWQLVDETDGSTSLLFTTGLPVDGLPEERHAAIMRWVIDSRDAFFRYLRLLLADMDQPFGLASGEEDDGTRTWRAAGDDAPLLEEMVRALCKDPARLRAVERVISRLEAGTGENPIPPEFLSLWGSFRQVLKNQAPPNAYSSIPRR